MISSHFTYTSIKKLDALPASCGVYFFLGKNKEILYIGKSTNIRKRIHDHLRPSPTLRASSQGMHNEFKQQARWIGWVETETEVEALLKEAEYIKQHLPKGNVLLKDDKKYFYVAIVSQNSFSKNKKGLPYILLTHQPHTFDAFHIIGPFTEGRAVKKLLRYLRKIFPYFTAKRHGPKKCPYCHLNLCPGPAPDEKAYKASVAILIKILEGKYRMVERNLLKKMNEASKNLAFEKAQRTKETLEALEKVFAHKDFLASQDAAPPGRRVSRGHPAALYLQKILNTKQEIAHIEGYDISNIQGHEPTASMVRFDNGLPHKNLYRKFHIRLPERPNDFAMMREVISRRFNHPEWPYPDLILIDGGKGQLHAAQGAMHTFFLSHPAERKRVIALSERKVPLIASIAKHYNELFIPGKKNSLKLDTDVDPFVRNLLMYVRDESHRFAISYHRKLHRKTFAR